MTNKSSKSDDQLAQILWDYNHIDQPVEKSDCILVLCSHDLRIARHGAKIFLRGYAPLLVFSGKEGRLTKDLWNKPEAEMFAHEAIRMGVPKENIIIENRSTNTGENILFTKELLRKKNINPKSFILVQKPYMLRRALASFKKLWPGKEIFITAPQISFQNYPTKILTKERIINIVVGDTQRMRVYPSKGFQIPQHIPNQVWQAYQELVHRGYTSHLVKESSSE